MLELLDLLCPAVAGLPVAEKQRALAYAINKRPACLSTDEQDEAQALYAGYLLARQKSHQSGNIAPVGVTSESEGDLSRSYGNNGIGNDQYGYLAAYKALRDKCASMLPMRRG